MCKLPKEVDDQLLNKGKPSIGEKELELQIAI